MIGRYWIETWGCQMNVHDSEKMAGVLEGLGYRLAPERSAADLVLLNTCAIREKAEDRVYTALEQLRPLKLSRPEMIIGVCGCVAQMTGEAVFARAPFVDLVIGPRAVSRLPDLLGRLKDERGLIDTTLYQDSVLQPDQPVRRGRTKAYVTIMEGCNKTCTYCVVPGTRGREVSRPLDAVLSEVQQLAHDGFREVEFLGQNVNAYRCPASRAGLGDLLRGSSRVAGVKRLRFTTSHPLHLREPIIRAMAEVPQVCDYLHLPVQSGSSRILARMRRGYDREKYLDRIDEVRSAVAGISLSTDVIVGFPGETERDFEQTLSLVESVRFDQMFSFVYSARPGTPAAELADDVVYGVKVRRLMRLQALQHEIQLERHRELIGREFEVLVEGPSRRDPQEWAGRTTCNRVVNFSAPESGPGQFVRVVITAAGPNSLRARRLECGTVPGLVEIA
ncbi:MAG: tRNA (N6-isopentenyl adenosine(37)-C2)-methylthiotransferase MiaB [Acidobacteriota bacterium]|nr:MAG: tRNA (N6-isopentenyl adenosine(37)-C2)-methylthiotransferase MiaB [Acidobacteriota bacterium]